MPRHLILVAVLTLLLAGCDMLGIESATVVADKRLAEGKAIGAACRHAGRAIEDCYALNKKSDKAPIYAGWREMDDYMRENKLEPVLPLIKPEEPKAKPKPADAQDGDSADASAEPKAEGKPDTKARIRKPAAAAHS
jgi:hypothetical protein